MVAATCTDPVTVVIPAYNLDAYLQDAIESVFKQQYDGPVSIIVLDDGSTDQSLDVANRMAGKVTNLKVVTQTNQGRARTRNRMLELAETDLVAWLDGDDLAAPCWLADQIGYLHSNPDCVAVVMLANSQHVDRRLGGLVDTGSPIGLGRRLQIRCLSPNSAPGGLGCSDLLGVSGEVGLRQVPAGVAIERRLAREPAKWQALLHASGIVSIIELA